MKEQVNGDGDTLEDIKPTWKAFPLGGVEHDYIGCDQWWKINGTCGFVFTVDCYRITAKHSDIFDLACMDFETWARAAISLGEIKRERNGCIEIYDTMSNGYLHGRRCMPTSGHKVDYRITIATHDHSTWTAIPRPAAPAGEPPALWIRCDRKNAEQYSWKSFGGEWKEWYDCPPEHQNNGYKYRYRRAEAPAEAHGEVEPKWEFCKYTEAEQCQTRVLCGSLGMEGRWSEWSEDIVLGRGGLEARYRRHTAAEAQGGEDARKLEFTQNWYSVRWQRLRDLIHDKAPQIEPEACCIIANGTTGAATGEYEPPTYAQTLNQLRYRIKKLEHPRPALDLQAVCEAKLTAIIKWLELHQPDVFSRRLWDAIQAAPDEAKGEAKAGIAGKAEGC